MHRDVVAKVAVFEILRPLSRSPESPAACLGNHTGCLATILHSCLGSAKAHMHPQETETKKSHAMQTRPVDMFGCDKLLSCAWATEPLDNSPDVGGECRVREREREQVMKIYWRLRLQKAHGR